MGWSSRIMRAANKYAGKRRGSGGRPAGNREMKPHGGRGAKGMAGGIGGMIRRALKRR